MKKLLIVEAVLLAIALVLGAMWALNPSGPYEPFIAVIGLIMAVIDIIRRKSGETAHTHPMSGEITNTSQQTTVTTITTKPTNTPPITGSISPAANKYDMDKSISKLTVKEIITEINLAPPYQKEELSTKYAGIRVDWVGYLKEAFQDPRDKTKVRINLNVETNSIIGYSFWFSESPDIFPEIRILKREAAIRVIGDIESASGPGLSVTLHPISIEVVTDENA